MVVNAFFENVNQLVPRGANSETART